MAQPGSLFVMPLKAFSASGYQNESSVQTA
jgi:hypothetical protein